MSDNVENLILEHLRGMRGSQERVEHELHEIKNRITSLESGVAEIRRDSSPDWRPCRALFCDCKWKLLNV